jgi:RHS repeat-associated protein
VSSTGSLTASTAYDAWGDPETAGGLSSYTPFGFAGGYTDPTGLIYLIDRYYEPVTGQFISIDPEVSQTQEPYQYADDNPLTNTDPTGCVSCAKVKGYKLLWQRTTATYWTPWRAYYGWFFNNIIRDIHDLFEEITDWAPALSTSFAGLRGRTSYFDQYFGECDYGHYIVTGYKNSSVEYEGKVTVTAAILWYRYTIFSGWYLDPITSGYTGSELIYYKSS